MEEGVMENLINIVDGVLANVRISEEQKRRENGPWFPACQGTEVPFTSRSGLRLLYCWQPSTGRHAYINLATDILLTDEEAQAALMTW
jgi:hypothetical protein